MNFMHSFFFPSPFSVLYITVSTNFLWFVLVSPLFPLSPVLVSLLFFLSSVLMSSLCSLPYVLVFLLFCHLPWCTNSFFSICPDVFFFLSSIFPGVLSVFYVSGPSVPKGLLSVPVFCDLGIVSTLMRVFFLLKLTLLLCCSPPAPSFARMSACSLPDIPQWAGIHCRTALLVNATCCRALARFGSLWFW